MAKSKNKNDIVLINMKKNGNVVKNGANVVKIKPKGQIKSKKKLTIDGDSKKNTVASKQESIEKRKERNRKKYQNQQKKYSDYNKTKTKKKIIIDEVDNKNVSVKNVDNKKSVSSNEETVIKKKSSSPKKKEAIERKKRSEKRKTNKITETIVNIKSIGVDTINNVKEITNDKNIPVGITKDEKKQRFKRLVEESLVFSIIITIIDVICILAFDYANFLRLFDVKSLNIIVTVIISLIFNFFIGFAVDYFITSLWVRIKRKKEAGEHNGNSGIEQGKDKKDIEDKEGK